MRVEQLEGISEEQEHMLNSFAGRIEQLEAAVKKRRRASEYDGDDDSEGEQQQKQQQQQKKKKKRTSDRPLTDAKTEDLNVKEKSVRKDLQVRIYISFDLIKKLISQKKT